MLEAGNCITILARGKPHLYILLTEPQGDPLAVIAVNLTSFKSKEESDTTLVLEGGHSFIKKPTTVNYAKARLADSNGLEAKINDQQDQTSFHHERKCSDDFLQKLRKGLRESPYTPPPILKYCEDKF